MSVYLVRWLFILASALILVAMSSLQMSEIALLGQSLFSSFHSVLVMLFFLCVAFVVCMSVTYFCTGKKWQVLVCFFCMLVLVASGSVLNAYYIDLITSRASVLVAMSCIIFYSLWVTDKPEMKIQRMLCFGVVFVFSLAFTSTLRVGGEMDIMLVGFLGNALYLLVTFCSLESAAAIGRSKVVTCSGRD